MLVVDPVLIGNTAIVKSALYQVKIVPVGKVLVTVYPLPPLILFNVTPLVLVLPAQLVTVFVLQLSAEAPFPVAVAVAFIRYPLVSVTAGDKSATLTDQVVPEVVVVLLPTSVVPLLW